MHARVKGWLKRLGKMMLGFSAVLVALVLVLALTINYMDWAWLKPHIKQYAEGNYNLRVEINGPLRIKVFPKILLSAEDTTVVDIGNPLKADLFYAKDFVIKVNLLPLFKGDVEIAKILLKDSELNLNLEAIAHLTALGAEGRNEAKNAGKKSKPEKEDDAWPLPAVEDIEIANFVFRYHDGVAAPSVLEVRQLGGQALIPPEQIILAAKGAAEGEAFSIDLQAGEHNSSEGGAYPTKASFLMDGVNATVTGDLVALMQGAEALNLRLNVTNTTAVAHVAGKESLRAPPFTLAAKIARDADDWTVSNIKAGTGESLFLGEVRYSPGVPKDLITADMVSPKLRFVDLAPFMSGGAAEKNSVRQAKVGTASHGSDKSPSLGARLEKDKLADIAFVLPNMLVKVRVDHMELPLVKGRSQISMAARIKDDTLSIDHFTTTLGKRRKKLLSAVSVKGAVGKIPSLDGMNLIISAKGNDAESVLSQLMTLQLPNRVPPYQLHSQWTREKGLLALPALSFRFGGSYVRGSAAFSLAAKPSLIAKFFAPNVNTNDFAAFTGDLVGDEDAKPTSKKKGVSKKSAEAKVAWVLPNTPLPWDALTLFDARLDVKLGKLVGPNETLSLNKANLSAQLRNGDLTVRDMSFQTKDNGIFAGHLRLRTTTKVPELSSSVAMNALNVGKIAEPATSDMPLEDLRAPELISAKIGGYADIKTKGRSLKHLAQNAHGLLGVYSESGKVSRLVIEAVGIDITEGIGAFAQNTPTTPLDCLIAVIPIKRGVAKFEDVMLATKDSNIYVDGSFDITDGKSNLDINSRPRDFSVGSLRAPIEIKGPVTSALPQPKYEVIAMKGLASVALGVLVNPVAAVLPLVEPAPGNKRVCHYQKDVIASVEKRSKVILQGQESALAH